jgi:Putative beta barrel porin-7 (BBP7)
LKRHWMRAAVLMGILARAGSAAAQEYAPPGSFDPMPVAPSGGGGMGPPPSIGGMPPGPMGLERLLNGPNAFHDGEHEAPPEPECPILSVSAEGLVGWTKRAPLNAPLVTNSTNLDTSTGALGQLGTTVAFGGNGLPSNTFNGGRLTFDLNLQENCRWLLPIEVSFFYMAQQRTDFIAQSDNMGFPPLARPIFATQLDLETSYLSAFPGELAGAIRVTSASRLWGFDINVLGMSGPLVADGPCNNIRMDVFLGYRYLDLSEDLQVFSTASSINSQFSVPFQGALFGPGNTTEVNDVFRTHNHFSGAQLGGRINWASGPFFINLGGKAAIGGVEQIVNIYGTSSLVTQGIATPVTLPGGILAVPSNGGLHHRSEFCFLPEGTFTCGIDITQNIRVQVGYDILYLSSVVRPGTHVSAAVDTRQVVTDVNFNPAVTVTDPRFQWHATNFYVQALSVGMTIRY